MTDHSQPLGAPSIGVGFSRQTTPDGQILVGIHIDLPLASFVYAMDINSARELSKNFGPELRKVLFDIQRDLIREATEAQKGATVVPSSNPLIVSEGN